MKVRVTFIEPILGTLPSNKEIASEFIASKAPDAKTIEDEIAAIGVEAVQEKGMTVFPRNEKGEPVLYDYQIKGFFKDACSMLSRLSAKDDGGKRQKGKPVNSIATESVKMTAYKKIIDGLIFPEPRMIPIHFDGEIGNCQRPLRAQTAQGERVSLANSEEIPAGATCEFSVHCMDPKHEDAVREWLNYAKWRGFGQWRNSGKGRLVWDELDDAGNVIGGNNEFLRN